MVDQYLHLGITIGTVLTMIGFLLKASHRFTQLELKTNVIWDFIMRRALSEGLMSGILTYKSPLTLTPEAREKLQPMKDELRKFYQEVGHKLDERDLFIELEKKYGDRLIADVCVPLQLQLGASIIAASLIAKEAVDPIVLPPVPSD